MKVTSSVMDLYFGYNMRVGDVQGAKDGIKKFQQIANTSNNPEQIERYANAAKKLQTEILPMLQSDVCNIGKQLGLPQSHIGSVISIFG